MQQFIAKALGIRPDIPKTPFESLKLQLVHGSIRDGNPVSLPANAQNRWFDEPYTNCATDENTGDAVVCLFGITEAGNSSMVIVNGYRPSVRVELPLHAATWGDAEVLRAKLAADFRIRKDSTVTMDMEYLKRFYGWVPEKDTNSTRRFAYILLRFSTWRAAQVASYILERENLNVTDKNVKPLMKFMNDAALTPSDWVTFIQPERLDTKLQRMSNCQMEFSVKLGSLQPCPNDAIAPMLIVSFDGEMFSNDGAFPSVMKGDSSIYIGASFWTYGTPISSTKRFVMCLGDIHAPEDSDIELARFPTLQHLIEGFRDLIVAADPDIVTGWNTYGFDYPFLHEDYAQSFLMPFERGSEDLQVAAIQAARASMGLPSTVMNTAASLLSKVRSRRGEIFTREWLKKSEKTFGTRHVKTLIKLERGVSDAAGSLALFGVDEEEEEEEEEAIGVSGLPAKTANEMRRNLRTQLLGDGEEAHSYTPTTFAMLIKDASAEQLIDFWRRMSLHGEAVVKMLQNPVTPSGAMRGLCLSRFAAERVSLLEKRMSSAAKGDNTYYFWGMTGRINVDLMQIIKDDKKPDDNTLKFAADHWLGGGSDNAKLDLSASDMFAAYASGDPVKRWDIANYCARDCDIPLKLISKLSYVPIWIEMSRVCFTWAQDVVNSGQQVKVFNLISRFVHGEYALNIAESGWPKNSRDGLDEDDRKRKPDYQGATVIEPVAGFYPDCISTLDFESLYPSIIRYFNLCPSVLVLDPSILTRPDLSVESHDIQHNIFDRGTYKSETRSYSFVSHVQGVLPKLLKRLLDARKAVKLMMSECGDPQQKAVLNGRQNGIKVACNSVYGFCGVSEDRGLLPCKPVAAVTTLKGRAFIEAAKNYVERHYIGSKVIYGDTDSVMIFWGKDVDVNEAALRGEEAAEAITGLLRAGSIAEIGGAGALAALALSQPILSPSGTRRSPIRDLATACSAVTLAYEKTYRPYLLLKKKNYAGLKYTSDGKGGFKTEIDMKGIDAVRRDRPKLLRDTSNAVLQALLNDRSVSKAMEALRISLQTIASDAAPLEDFVLSKSLKGHYASPNLPHVTAWKRMSERGDEGIPPVGARMPYIVVVDKAGGGGKKSSTKLYERTEHPSYVKASNLTVDRQYYVETLQNPLVKLLQFVVSDAEIKTLFREAVDRASMTSSRIGSLLNIEGGGKRQNVLVRPHLQSARAIGGIKRKAEASEPQKGLRAFM